MTSFRCRKNVLEMNRASVMVQQLRGREVKRGMDMWTAEPGCLCVAVGSGGHVRLENIQMA